MSRRPTLASLPAVLLLMLAAAAPASAFDLSNCFLQLNSLDADGNVLDSAAGPGAGGTSDDPFLVDWHGSVHYFGTSPQALMDHSWHIDVFMIPTPLRGGDPNTAGDQDGEDTVGVSENAPIPLAGLFYVSGEITSPDGSCTGSAWFKVDENPFTTIPFWAAVAVTVLAIVFLWFSQPSVRPSR